MGTACSHIITHSDSCYQLNCPKIFVPSPHPKQLTLSCPFGNQAYKFQRHHMCIHVPCTSFSKFSTAMHLAVVPAPRSIQQLLEPILAIDRIQQQMEQCLYELDGLEDDLRDLNIYGVPPMLRTLTNQLRLVITQVKIHKLRLLCQLQRSIYLQWRHHQCFPWRAKSPTCQKDCCVLSS